MLEAAVAAGREAIRLKPDDADAHSNLGNALAARGSSTRPSPNSARRSGSSPTTPRAHFNLGIALYASGEARRGRSPSSARRSGSSPTTPRPTPTSASPCSQGKLDEAVAESARRSG